MKIKLKIQHSVDREKIVSGLVNSNFRVTIERSEYPNNLENEYFIVIENTKNSKIEIIPEYLNT